MAGNSNIFKKTMSNKGPLKAEFGNFLENLFPIGPFRNNNLDKPILTNVFLKDFVK